MSVRVCNPVKSDEYPPVLELATAASMATSAAWLLSRI